MLAKYMVMIGSCMMLLFTTGCDISKHVTDAISKSETQTLKSIQQSKQQVSPYVASSRKKGFWVSAQQVNIKDDEPDWLDDPVIIRVAKKSSVSEMLSILNGTLHAPISMKPDALAAIAAIPSGSDGGLAPAGIDPTSGVSSAPGGEISSVKKSIIIDYKGTKRGLLDYLAGQLGIYWRSSHDVIEFYLLETRLFHISTLGGTIASNATVGGSSTGTSTTSSEGGTAGGSAVNAGSQDLSVTMKSEVWNELVKVVSSLVSAQGKVEASESLGLITITDVPSSLASVEKVINELNHSMRIQILIDVKVYSLEINSKDDYQLDWNTIFTTAQGSVLNFATIPAATTGLSSITATLTSQAPRWKRWNGTNGIVKALSKIGKVVMVTSGTMITMNNQPVPINLQRSVTYLASSGAGAISTGVATGPTLTPGTVNTGFQMNVMPRVVDSNKVMLQCSLNISSLQSLGTISSGTGVNTLTIQTPEVVSRSLLQRAMLQSGETLILTGFESTELTNNRQGVGDPNNIYTGGAHLTSEKKSTLIVMITPYLVDTKR